MKTVFSTHSDVCHVWAQQTQQKGEATNVFFEGKDIYSWGYHFVIASFYKKDIVLFTSRNYSVSTSSHKNLVWSAVSDKTIITVPFVKRSEWYKNAGLWQKEYDELMHKLSRARKPELYIQRLNVLAGLISQFCNTVRYWTKLRKQSKALYLLAKNGFKANEGLMQEIRERQDRERENAKLKLSQDINKWKDGEISWVPNSGNNAFLKLRPQDNVIVTSKNVWITYEEGKVLFNIWKSDPNKMIAKKVAKFYRVSLCDHNYLKAGCHTIHISEAENIATQLKW